MFFPKRFRKTELEVARINKGCDPSYRIVKFYNPRKPTEAEVKAAERFLSHRDVWDEIRVKK